MAAVANRSYPASLVLFDAALRVAKESSDDPETQKKTLMSMVFPAMASNADSSPLHVICCNDTCSFTWTGAEHINQVRLADHLSFKSRSKMCETK
jgi:E3 ubiquitin-protein ligase EDD1